MGRALLIDFTYIGTVVGAGFATGQEILQFFTLYGRMATITIFISSLLFIWLGTKVMMISRDIQANSYEDMNIHLFGSSAGRWVSILMMFLLLAITTVMLAGAGYILHDHLNLSYQTSLLLTMVMAYLVIAKGIQGIKVVNSFVVPVMLLFTIIVLSLALTSPAGGNFLRLSTEYPLWRIWLSPFLYAAFNLALSQAVLVPLGATTLDRRTIYLGGLIGGVGITLMLIAGHISLSASMPGIAQHDIPMGYIIQPLGHWMQLLFIFIIYAEIFTTLIADVYGITLQIEQRTKLPSSLIVIFLLGLSYLVSQIGFKALLSTLYPLMGFISLIWMVMIALKRRKLDQLQPRHR